jgi:hypothetical protein
LLEALQVWFEQPLALRGLDSRTGQQVEKGHGRLEQRSLTASTELNDYLDWPGLQQVLRAQRRFVNTKTGVVTHEVRYGITSLTPQQADATTLLEVWRGHWAIENQLHWSRDVCLEKLLAEPMLTTARVSWRLYATSLYLFCTSLGILASKPDANIVRFIPFMLSVSSFVPFMIGLNESALLKTPICP